jgi:gliding motility-associated-like protein
VVWQQPAFTDNVFASLVHSSHTSGDVLSAGKHVVQYIVADEAGNSATCSFSVVVKTQENPVLECAADQKHIISETEAGKIVHLSNPVVTGLCTEYELVRTDLTGLKSGDLFPEGHTVIAYELRYGAGKTASCATSIIIERPTSVPITAIDDDFVIAEDNAADLAVTINDALAGGSYSLNLLQQPAHGDAQVVNGLIRYTPDENYNGADVFRYRVCYVHDPTICDDATVNINVQPVNDAPVFIDYSHSSTDDGTLIICLRADDADGDAVYLAEVLDMPAEAELIELRSEEMCVEYVPAPGRQHFSFLICDSHTPKACVEAKVDFEILAQKDLSLYKGISPNGDGQNDAWIIGGIERFKENEVRIFDRWGKLVYKCSNYNNNENRWEGQANVGSISQVPNGPYFYEIKLHKAGQTIQGYVEVLR